MALEWYLKPSTHPISQIIKQTGDALSTFDAISYKKGASWIKTMDYFLGRPTLQLAT
jgi:aminopeptidase N